MLEFKETGEKHAGVPVYSVIHTEEKLEIGRIRWFTPRATFTFVQTAPITYPSELIEIATEMERLTAELKEEQK